VTPSNDKPNGRTEARGPSGGSGSLLVPELMAKVQRIQLRWNSEDARLESAGHYLAEAESGWDFTPRFDGRCADFAPVDLNALLFRSEQVIAELAGELGQHALRQRFDRAAATRRQLIDQLLWEPRDGIYRDWDTVGCSHSPVASLASFYPLWCAAASQTQARSVAGQLARFEYAGGLSACEAGPRSTVHQWDYPNGWAPLHLIAVEGMLQYGCTSDAQRIGRKFAALAADGHARTGEFWEKYNVVRSSLDVCDEYPMPPLVGWTAAALLALHKLG